MSLNDWSILYFGVNALYVFFLYIALFTKATLTKFITMAVVWAATLATTLVYGLATGQIGFVGMFVMQVMLTASVFTATGKMFNNANN